MTGVRPSNRLADEQRTLIREVHYVAWIARETWQEFWPSWRRLSGDPTPEALPASLGACIPSAIALAGLLNLTHGPGKNWFWRVRGGYRTRRGTIGGVLMPDGRGGPHLWAEGVRIGGARLVITADITLDQFGGPPVLVTAGRPETHRHNYDRAMLAKLTEGVGLHDAIWQSAAMFALDSLGSASDKHPDIKAEQKAADRHLGGGRPAARSVAPAQSSSPSSQQDERALP